MSEVEDMKTPTLTFEPDLEETASKVLDMSKEQKPVKAAVLDESTFSQQERQMVQEFADKIDLNNSNIILQYGSGAQKKIAAFSESALNNVKTKDLGEVGKMLSGVVIELKNFDSDEDEKGIFGIFKKGANKINTMKAKYDKAEVNINKIVTELEKHQMQLLKDVAMLDKMYDMNKVYFKELSMYILAGKKKLLKVQQEELPVLLDRAKETGLPEDAQSANDLSALLNRFDKKIHDLELTRMISIQMAPQIRLIQNNDTMMSEKIQSTLVNTIPLWKSQMVLALGVSHSQQAARAQREVTNMTNELLKKNAETLKLATIETARESERGIIDIETLRVTNQNLISTLDEVMKIQQEGSQKRREAEVELGRIEGELKQKLLNIRG